MVEAGQGCPGLVCRGCGWPPCSLGAQGDASLACGRWVARGSRIRAGAGPATTPRGQSHVPGRWARGTLLSPGPSWGASALALHCSPGPGAYSLMVVGIWQEGVRRASGAGLSCSRCGLHLPCSNAPRTLLCNTSPLPGFHPSQAPLDSIGPWCRSPLPASCIPPPPRAAEVLSASAALCCFQPNPALPNAGRTQSPWDPDANNLPWARDPPRGRAEPAALQPCQQDACPLF